MPLRNTRLPVLVSLLAMLTLTSCTREVVKYERVPLVLSSEVTDLVKPPLFQKDTDLVEYALQLLGDIEQMNQDRATVRKAVDTHNGTAVVHPVK